MSSLTSTHILTETKTAALNHGSDPRPEGRDQRYITQGQCPEHDVILEWDSRLKIGHVTKGELCCPSCKSILVRTHSLSSLPRVWKNPARVAT